MCYVWFAWNNISISEALWKVTVTVIVGFCAFRNTVATPSDAGTCGIQALFNHKELHCSLNKLHLVKLKWIKI